MGAIVIQTTTKCIMGKVSQTKMSVINIDLSSQHFLLLPKIAMSGNYILQVFPKGLSVKKKIK